MPEGLLSNGTKSGAKQQRANEPEPQGQPADHVLATAVDPFTAHDDNFEPLPTPQVRKDRRPALLSM